MRSGAVDCIRTAGGHSDAINKKGTIVSVAPGSERAENFRRSHMPAEGFVMHKELGLLRSSPMALKKEKRFRLCAQRHSLG